MTTLSVLPDRLPDAQWIRPSGTHLRVWLEAPGRGAGASLEWSLDGTPKQAFTFPHPDMAQRYLTRWRKDELLSGSVVVPQDGELRLPCPDCGDAVLVSDWVTHQRQFCRKTLTAAED